MQDEAEKEEAGEECSSLEGWLQKQGEKRLTNKSPFVGPKFKRRYFVFAPDTNAIRYYTKKTNIPSGLKAAIDCHRITFIRKLPIPKTKGKKKREILGRTFEIITPDRIYHLRAENEEACNFWVQHLLIGTNYY